jgi:DNA repair exonuclease SbcCD nuclease subunit
MKKIILGDTHIDEKSLKELDSLMRELIPYACSDTEFIHLGDFFDKKKPTPAEIHVGTWFVKSLLENFGKVTILKGNHDTVGQKEVSAIDYLEYLGANIVSEYVDDMNNFYGHFFTDKSMYEYGTHTHTTKQLEKYNYVLLGHQHNPQKVNNHIWHLGSSRYVNFNEVTDKYKQIAMIYPKNNSIKFVSLSTPIKMYDVANVSDLVDMKPGNKVRMIISSFAQFKREITEINKYKNKFVDFKIKLDFETEINTDEIEVSKEKKSLHTIINEELEKVEDEDVKKLLKEQFKEDE